MARDLSGGSDCKAPVCSHIDHRALLDFPRSFVSGEARTIRLIKIEKTIQGITLIAKDIHGLDVIGQWQVLHAAVGANNALLDFVAPHVAVNELPQKMRVHNREFWVARETRGTQAVTD